MIKIIQYIVRFSHFPRHRNNHCENFYTYSALQNTIIRKYSMPTWVCFCWPEPEEFLCVCLASKFRWGSAVNSGSPLSFKGILLQFAIFCLTQYSSFFYYYACLFEWVGSLIKKKRKFSSYIGNSEGIGFKVIND
jgi:hypothetical protein